MMTIVAEAAVGGSEIRKDIRKWHGKEVTTTEAVLQTTTMMKMMNKWTGEAVVDEVALHHKMISMKMMDVDVDGSETRKVMLKQHAAGVEEAALPGMRITMKMMK
jgi:hypothetical protein